MASCALWTTLYMYYTFVEQSYVENMLDCIILGVGKTTLSQTG